MTAPIDLVLARAEAHGLRRNGPNRWRCACPVCGGRSKTTLSIGVRDDGAVLLCCFKSQCDVESIAHALGLELTDLFPPRESHGRPQRRRLLSDRQALEVVAFECLLVWTAAFNLANGHALTHEDLRRLHTAGVRIQGLAAEVRS